jgi:hypothetical protein
MATPATINLPVPVQNSIASNTGRMDLEQLAQKCDQIKSETIIPESQTTSQTSFQNKAPPTVTVDAEKAFATLHSLAKNFAALSDVVLQHEREQQPVYRCQDEEKDRHTVMQETFHDAIENKKKQLKKNKSRQKCCYSFLLCCFRC